MEDYSVAWCVNLVWVWAGLVGCIWVMFEDGKSFEFGLSLGFTFGVG